MTWEILFVLGLTSCAVVLFVTEKFTTDVVAVLVMVALLVSGVLSPTEGLAGFANTATVTVGAMFALSAGMSPIEGTRQKLEYSLPSTFPV